MAQSRNILSNSSGAALVEFTLIGGLFLFMLFAVIEGALLTAQWMQTEKATQAGVRHLAVRAPLVAGLPDLRGKNPALDPTTIRYGELCALDPATTQCAVVAAQSCTIDVPTGATTCADATAAADLHDLMGRVAPFAFDGRNAGTVTVTYADSGIGFVGGPFVANVTVELTGLRYRLIALGGLGALVGLQGGAEVPLPRVAVTQVGEDLSEGGGG